MELRSLFTSPPRWLAASARWATRLELGAGAVFLLVIFFLVLIQALQRYLPFEGWSWTGELARFSLVWLTFITAGVLVSTDSHISIEVSDAIRSPMVRRVVRVISCLIVAAIGVALTLEAWALFESQRILKSPALQMPMSWFYVVALVGFVSTTVRATVAALRYAVVGVPDEPQLPLVGGGDTDGRGAL